MSSSIRQGFTFPRSDIQRAKTAAATSGMSMNEWMRRTVCAALDGPKPAAMASVGALDTSALDAIAQRLDALVGRHEADAAANHATVADGRVVVEDMKRAGASIARIVSRVDTAARTPVAPVARAPIPAALPVPAVK